MCERHEKNKLPLGSALEHGAAHGEHHERWSRRDFISTLSGVAAGSVVIGGAPVSAFGGHGLLGRLAHLETDRILVLVQLSGGNDGLNTIIPVDDDAYFAARPGVAIPKNTAVQVEPGTGLHPRLSPLVPLYNDGDLAIVHSVGYPSPNLSHFRSTDIWMSGSGSEEVVNTGWAGRYLDAEFPDFSDDPPAHPLAVQIGGNSTLMFQGPAANMGMTMASLQIFTQLAETGELFDAVDVPATTYGAEMGYVRSVANDAFTYAEAVQTAATAGSNAIEYPPNNPLAANLAVVAQLISGNLDARIYTVVLGGFDTHANQLARHDTLLRYVADALAAFQADLAAAGNADRVLTMTFSEFGRRVNQNGSAGTDHGTAAPLFVAGTGINGGMYGSLPSLQTLDENGNLIFQTDFRSIYATVLYDWFGFGLQDTDDVFGGSFPRLPLVSDPASHVAIEDARPRLAYSLKQNYPNPFGASTTLSYSLDAPDRVRLEIYDVQGRLVQRIVDRQQQAGAYAYPFDAGHLPSGTYFYRLQTSSGTESRKMTIVR